MTHQNNIADFAKVVKQLMEPMVRSLEQKIAQSSQSLEQKIAQSSQTIEQKIEQVANRCEEVVVRVEKIATEAHSLATENRTEITKQGKAREWSDVSGSDTTGSLQQRFKVIPPKPMDIPRDMETDFIRLGSSFEVPGVERAGEVTEIGETVNSVQRLNVITPRPIAQPAHFCYDVADDVLDIKEDNVDIKDEIIEIKEENIPTRDEASEGAEVSCRLVPARFESSSYSSILYIPDFLAASLCLKPVHNPNHQPLLTVNMMTRHLHMLVSRYLADPAMDPSKTKDVELVPELYTFVVYICIYFLGSKMYMSYY